jgi:hypothetical protein
MPSIISHRSLFGSPSLHFTSITRVCEARVLAEDEPTQLIKALWPWHVVSIDHFGIGISQGKGGGFLLCSLRRCGWGIRCWWPQLDGVLHVLAAKHDRRDYGIPEAQEAGNTNKVFYKNQ